MKPQKGSLKKRVIMTFPILLILLVNYSYSFWLEDVFISFGLHPMKTYYLFLVMLITFMIGYYAGELRAYLNARMK